MAWREPDTSARPPKRSGSPVDRSSGSVYERGSCGLPSGRSPGAPSDMNRELLPAVFFLCHATPNAQLSPENSSPASSTPLLSSASLFREGPAVGVARRRHRLIAVVDGDLVAGAALAGRASPRARGRAATPHPLLLLEVRVHIVYVGLATPRAEGRARKRPLTLARRLVAAWLGLELG